MDNSMFTRALLTTFLLSLVACASICPAVRAADADSEAATAPEKGSPKTEPAKPAEPPKLDWSEWESLPVFYRGRIMPLDTFARDAVADICGREFPTLLPDTSSPSAMAATKSIFPDGDKRKFRPAELLFSWLIQADAWQRVPVLHAEYIELREDVLSLPLVDKQGRRLKFVSPRVLERSREFASLLESIDQGETAAHRHGDRFVPDGLQKSARELELSRRLFSKLAFDPEADLGTGQAQFSAAFNNMLQMWWPLQQDLQQWQQISQRTGRPETVAETVTAMDELRGVLQGGELSREDLEKPLAKFRQATASLAAQVREVDQRRRDLPPNDELPAETQQRMLKWISRLAWKADQLAIHARETHLALYDNGRSIHVVPSLNPYALEVYRGDGDNAQPWLSIEALLFGTPEVLEGYPSDLVEEVRSSFAEAKEAYLDHDHPKRADRFAEAMKGFSAAVRKLGVAIEPLREKLPVKERDEEMMAVTAYPSAKHTATEMSYNQKNPFLLTWIISLVSVAAFSFSFGFLRKPMFWLGVVILMAAVGVITYGFTLRVMITGDSPVTNMFETMVFVAWCVGFLGLWFSLQPLFWPGLSLSWRLAAFPFTWEEKPLEEAHEQLISFGKARFWSLLAVIPRLALMGVVYWALVIVKYGEGKPLPIINLAPQTGYGASLPTADALLTWAAAMCVLVCSMWFTARAVAALLLSLLMVPYSLVKLPLKEPLRQVMSRKSYVLTGAFLTFLASILAYFAPIMNKEVGWGMQPVLRNNFWLTVHVLSITAAYAPGALAWMLGNISLGYFLFGDYRNVEKSEGRIVRRGPKVCSTLADYTYKAMQISVLLLVAGTILGGLWADVSWGRFWSWDPKEVWSLIAVLVFMVVLHGRYARWVGDFGFAAGAVLGLTAIAWAWYGVSYLMPEAGAGGGGRHSYGGGGGTHGQYWVIAIMVLNWWFVIAAGIRYMVETWRR